MAATTTLPVNHPGARTHHSFDVPKAHIVHPAYSCLWIWRLMLYGVLTAGALLGGPMVQLMAISGGVFALLMDWDGLFRHVCRWVALIGCIMVTPLAAPTVAIILPAKWVGISLFGIGFAAWLTFAVLFVIASIVVGLLFGQIRKRPWFNAINHFAGSALGATEGAMAVVVLYWGLSTFSDTFNTLEDAWSRGPERGMATAVHVDPALTDALVNIPGGMGKDGPFGITHLNRLRAYLATDPLARELDKHNVFEKIPAVKATSELTAIAADPDAIDAIARSSKLAKFAQRKDIQDRLRTLMSDPKIQAALDAKDFNVLVRSGALRQIVGDKELLKITQDALPELKGALQQTGQARLMVEAERLTPQRLASLQQSALHVLAAAEAGNKAMVQSMMQKNGVDEAELKKMKTSLNPVKQEAKAFLAQQETAK